MYRGSWSRSAKIFPKFLWIELDLWRFPIELNFLWTRVIKCILGLNSDSWDSNLASQVSAWSPWRSISKFRVRLVNVYCGARDGRRTGFWLSKWAESEFTSDFFYYVLRRKVKWQLQLTGTFCISQGHSKMKSFQHQTFAAAVQGTIDSR